MLKPLLSMLENELKPFIDVFNSLTAKKHADRNAKDSGKAESSAKAFSRKSCSPQQKSKAQRPVVEGAAEKSIKKNPIRGGMGHIVKEMLFLEQEDDKDAVQHVTVLDDQRQKVAQLIRIQNYIILGLAAAIIFLMPVLRPIYHYMAYRPDGAKKVMASMSVPNLTDQAVISWSATAITDILTFGFGDVDQRILSQRRRFTNDGWISFINDFFERQVKEKFLGNQLVLTTAPSDLPVIVIKGIDIDGEYKWIVEMPVVMNYSTNNLVSSRSKSIIRLILRRVPVSQSKLGIGIEKWIAE